MTILITLICLFIAVAIFSGSFYLAKYVVNLQHRVNVLEDSYKEAIDHIKTQEEHIIVLQQEIDFMRRDEERASQQSPRQRVWNPVDIMNSGERI